MDKQWYCVGCDEPLGTLVASELHVKNGSVRTVGANLVVVCPKCNTSKTWFTNDPIVRAVNQLLTVISDAAARSMIKQIGNYVHSEIVDK